MAVTNLDLIKRPVDWGLNKEQAIALAEFTADASYAAGGYALTASDYGLSSIVAVFPTGSSASGVLPVWVRSTGKLAFYKGASTVTVTSGNAAFTEAATNESLLTGVKVLLLIVGKL